MPHSASAKKRHRQNLRDRERNRQAKSGVKTAIKRVLEAVSAGDAKLAGERLHGAARTADRAVAKGTIHRNRAARIKSRLSARVRGLSAKPAGKAAKA
ncbi:MAG: 30S ribosomal protein S20 [Planctomycetes bacterium]|nr:30S ribosomal protein S20 [Planctomycetota bacterium]MBM4058107.1 30S ribosomal protein S20 [Planctomycetota bacterium]